MAQSNGWRTQITSGLLWGLITTLSWALAWIVTGGILFSSAVWDPDEVDAYVRASPWARLSAALWMGLFIGLVVGVAIGLFRLGLSRRGVRDALSSVLMTTAGSVGLCFLSAVGPAHLANPLIAAMRVGFVGGAIGGTCAGLGQWLVLRDRVKHADAWVWVSAVSWGLGWMVLSAAPDLPLGQEQSGYIYAARFLGGAIVGGGQWLILRAGFKRAAWWIPATAAGWVTAGGLPLNADIPAIGLGIISAGAFMLLVRRGGSGAVAGR